MSGENMTEEEAKFRDKLTGLWNRKYLEKIVENNEIENSAPDFTIVCTEIDNIKEAGEEFGPEATDKLLKDFATAFQDSSGEKAVCCRMAGTKLVAFLTATKPEFEENKKKIETFISTTVTAFPMIDISYGAVRREDFSDKDLNALVKEAEYALQMHKLSKENPEDAPTEPSRVSEEKAEVTILMIDDSLVLLRTLQTMLKDRYKVLMTTLGIEGYEIAKTKHPDLILLDYNMPVVDGERIMYLLKKSNVTKNIPVIFVSGVTEKEKILKVANLKPEGYLLKPVEKDKLLNVIYSVIHA